VIYTPADFSSECGVCPCESARRDFSRRTDATTVQESVVYSSGISRVITPRCDDHDGDEDDERVRAHFPSRRSKRVSKLSLGQCFELCDEIESRVEMFHRIM
ncbi:hypothetical protein ALC62_13162, partial [Cyphomyrmex costatus]